MAANTTREQAAAALFALVSGAIPGLKTTLRRYRRPEDVSPAQTPALFQVQTKEKYERAPGGLLGIPPKRTLHFELLLYVTDAANTVGGLTSAPSTQLNTMIQAIESALSPDQIGGQSTLGGLVASARIEGEIDYHETPVRDGLSAAAIPVDVLIP